MNVPRRDIVDMYGDWREVDRYRTVTIKKDDWPCIEFLEGINGEQFVNVELEDYKFPARIYETNRTKRFKIPSEILKVSLIPKDMDFKVLFDVSDIGEIILKMRCEYGI